MLTKTLGIFLIYTGLIIIVLAVRLPTTDKLISIIGLVVLGILASIFHKKIHKGSLLTGILIASTLALVMLPMVSLQVLRRLGG